MRYARYEVVFQLLVRVEFLCHVVDAVAQVADLVVVHLVDLRREITLRDTLGGLAHLVYGLYYRTDKIVARKRDDGDYDKPDDRRDDGVEEDLAVGIAKR